MAIRLDRGAYLPSWEQAFVFPWPPTLNHCYATNKFGKRVLKEKGRVFIEECRMIVTSERQHKYPKEQQLDVFVMAYPADRRRRDLMNIEKLLNDAMQIVLFEDDYQIADFRIRRGPLHKNGGAVRYFIRRHRESFDLGYD